MERVTLFVLLAITAGTSLAQRAGSYQPASKPGAQTLRVSVYEMLQQAQRCAEANDFTCAFDRLARVESTANLNSYERAQTSNFLAFLHFENGDNVAAIDSYEDVLAQPDLPAPFEQQIRYSLTTLYVGEERFDEGLAMLDRWWQQATDIRAEPYILRGQIQFQRGVFADVVQAVDEALKLAGSVGLEPQEGWFQLKAASLWELNDVEQVAGTLETMIRRWPKRDYFVQLAGLYGMLDNPERQFALYEAAYASGWLESESQLKPYFAMLMRAGRNADAAAAIVRSIRSGLIPDSDDNRALYTQALAAAAED